MIGGTTGHGNPSLLIRFLRFPLTRAPSAPTCLRSCLEITTRCFCLPDNPLKLRQPCPDARIEKRYRSSSFWQCHERFKIYVAAVSFSIRSKPFFLLFQLLVAASILEHAQSPTGIASIRDDSTGTRSRFPPTFFLFRVLFFFLFLPIEGASKLSRLICRRRAADSMKIRAISTAFVRSYKCIKFRR